MLTKRERILLIIDHYTEGYRTKFAALVGISPQLLNSWVLRGIYDAEAIFHACEGLSAQWLLTGEGDMLLESHRYIVRDTPSGIIKEVARQVGLTLTELANNINTRVQNLYEINTGRVSQVSPAILFAIHDRFPEISLPWLLTGLRPASGPSHNRESTESKAMRIKMLAKEIARLSKEISTSAPKQPVTPKAFRRTRNQ